MARWLISIGHRYVKWPTSDEISEVTSKFQSKKQIPHVIGAIDCSHITIKAPRMNKEAYFNRKHGYSIHLQAVVNADKKFIDVHCGEPGSLHDSRVLRRSPLYLKALENMPAKFPNNTFLLGDSAYPNLDWLVSPYKNTGSLTTAQRQFNYRHSSTRMVVENSFGLLKTRFRRLLHFSEQTYIENIVNLTVCGCILHNICLMENDVITADEDEINTEDRDEDETANINLENMENRRQMLFNELLARNIIIPD